MGSFTLGSPMGHEMKSDLDNELTPCFDFLVWRCEQGVACSSVTLWFEIVRRREQLAFSLACPPGSAVRAARYSGVNPVALWFAMFEFQRLSAVLATFSYWPEVDGARSPTTENSTPRSAGNSVRMPYALLRGLAKTIQHGSTQERKTSQKRPSEAKDSISLELCCLFSPDVSVFFAFLLFIFVWPCFPSLTHKGVHFFDISLSWEFAHLHLISSDFLPFWPSPSFIFSELWLLNFFRL